MVRCRKKVRERRRGTQVFFALTGVAEGAILERAVGDGEAAPTADAARLSQCCGRVSIYDKESCLVIFCQSRQYLLEGRNATTCATLRTELLSGAVGPAAPVTLEKTRCEVACNDNFANGALLKFGDHFIRGRENAMPCAKQVRHQGFRSLLLPFANRRGKARAELLDGNAAQVFSNQQEGFPKLRRNTRCDRYNQMTGTDENDGFELFSAA